MCTLLKPFSVGEGFSEVVLGSPSGFGILRSAPKWFWNSPKWFGILRSGFGIIVHCTVLVTAEEALASSKYVKPILYFLFPSTRTRTRHTPRARVPAHKTKYACAAPLGDAVFYRMFLTTKCWPKQK
jgi:hypothetical protein